MLPLRKQFQAEYRVWAGARTRCKNPNSRVYKNYGERGITFAPQWKLFVDFFRDMGPRPSAKHTLERIDNSKGYEPGNCKWATREEQNTNRRNVVMVEFRGEILPLPDVVRAHGKADVRNTRVRICRLGWDIERALSTPTMEGEVLRRIRQASAKICHAKRWGSKNV